MPRKPNAVPSLVHHKASGQVRVRIAGRDHYCGPWGDDASYERAKRLIAEHLLGHAAPTAQQAANSGGVLILELIVAYVTFAEGYYVKDGVPTQELTGIKDTLKLLREHYGSTPAADFGPMKLKALREVMIRKGWCRTLINQRIGRVRRMMKWATENELVPASVFHGLQAVAGLRIGRSEAPEAPPVQPVDTAYVNATLPHLGRVVKAMVIFQAATGCRPGEVCILRPCDVNRDGEVWEYRPHSHKTQHHGRDRVIYIGPKGQQVLGPFLDDRPANAYCFTPAEAEADRLATRHAARRVPQSYGNRPGTNRVARRQRKPGDKYDAGSYANAIRYAVKKSNRVRLQADENVELIPSWAPNQLRHSAATAIRKTYGIEAAQVTLGHAGANITQVYAERDASLGRKVAAEIG